MLVRNEACGYIDRSSGLAKAADFMAKVGGR
jgi:hypothetical protein